jgi:hypothetical protein
LDDLRLIQFPAGYAETGLAPVALSQGGRKLRLNIDHIAPREVSPFRFFDGDNLRVLPGSFNDTTLTGHQRYGFFPMTEDNYEVWIRSHGFVGPSR